MVTVALVALSMSLAACADDDDPDTASTTTGPATTAPATTAPAPTSPATTAPVTTVPAATVDCQTVAFTPGSEDAASSIRATGVSCAEAEAFVRSAGQRTSSGGPQQVTVDGYRCVLVRSVEDPLPQAFYECTDGDKKVTFVRT